VVLNKMSKKTPSQDSNFDWKQDMMDRWVLSEEERNLLRHGPRSLSQAWHMQALKYKYNSTK
jgi:hypothetical protein